MPECGSPAQTTSSPYQAYLEAAWGLKNHWYPALFSHEIGEGEIRATQIAGIPLVLRRFKGKVYALKDECVHRGVKLSLRPTCLTEDTITCWYHGFTYSLETGKLETIVAAPEDKLIGRVGLQAFPTEEVNGMVFVFVGDADYRPVPPLWHDLPIRLPDDYEHRVAYPLDPDTVLLGIHRTGNSNWRLGVENGADTGHIFIHYSNPLVLALDRELPLGAVANGPQAIDYFEGEGPKGVMNRYDGGYDVVVENKRVNMKARGTVPWTGGRTSMFLPGVLMVENWPKYRMAQYEWYVPIDDKRHEYWEVLAMTCRTDEERREFEFKYKHLWKELALGAGFNDHDLFAREAMQPFYERARGWREEKLCSLDAYIVAWRKMAAKYNRGIQSPPEGLGRS